MSWGVKATVSRPGRSSLETENTSALSHDSKENAVPTFFYCLRINCMVCPALFTTKPREFHVPCIKGASAGAQVAVKHLSQWESASYDLIISSTLNLQDKRCEMESEKSIMIFIFSCFILFSVRIYMMQKSCLPSCWCMGYTSHARIISKVRHYITLQMWTTAGSFYPDALCPGWRRKWWDSGDEMIYISHQR